MQRKSTGRKATTTTKQGGTTAQKKTAAKKPPARSGAGRAASTKKAVASRRSDERASAPARPPSQTDPAVRRAIFVDVENTSSEDSLLSVLGELNVDLQSQNLEFVAVGNWRVISNPVARTLAARGARLVHSAPATGVRDWSDLAIAVHAGIWLGRSAPGDVLEIVSADRAFDAVADVATALGVQYRRLSYGASSARETVEAEDLTGRRRRRRRRGGRGRPGAPTVEMTAGPPPSGPAPGTPREATPDEIRQTIGRLTDGGQRSVNLDLVIQDLKSQGFVRSPGSHRLVTRMRRISGIDVGPTGMVRFLGCDGSGDAEPAADTDIPEQEPSPVPAQPAPNGRGRRRRRGRGRSGRQDAAPRAAGPASGETPASPPEPRQPETKPEEPPPRLRIEALPGERLSVLGQSKDN